MYYIIVLLSYSWKIRRLCECYSISFLLLSAWPLSFLHFFSSSFLVPFFHISSGYAATSILFFQSAFDFQWRLYAWYTSSRPSLLFWFSDTYKTRSGLNTAILYLCVAMSFATNTWELLPCIDDWSREEYCGGIRFPSVGLSRVFSRYISPCSILA